MDPITATTTVITLATFIKDLIDVGQSIKRSIEKVRENRRRIRDLADDILSTLSKLADLSRVDERTFQAPAHLSALGDLKADMDHILSICKKISSAEPLPGIRGFRSQIKVWIKRDDVEAEIRRLKKHVNKCLLQFTTFSTARIEQTTHRTENTTLRVEQRLIVNHVENQIRLRRVEGLMARVLVETPFGQNVMSQTIEIIASDTTHQTLEFQYLSAQAMRVVDPLHHWIARNSLVLDAPLQDLTGLFFLKSVSPTHVLHQILGMILEISDTPAEIPFTSIYYVIDIGLSLQHLGMSSQAIVWQLLANNIFRRLAGGVPSSEILSHLAHAAKKLSHMYQDQLRWDLATETSQEALDWCRLWQEHSPDVDHKPLLGTILVTHSRSLSATGQHQVAISTAEEAVVVCHAMTQKLIESGSESSSWTEAEKYNATMLSQAQFVLAKALSGVGRHLEAYNTSKEGFHSVLKFSGCINAPAGADIDGFIDQMCKLAEEDGVSLLMLADSVILFRDLSSLYMQGFSSQFLWLLYAHAYLSQQDHSPDTGISLRNLRIFLEPDSNSPSPGLESSSDFALYLEGFDAHGGFIENAIQAFYNPPFFQIIHTLIRNIFICHFEQAIVVFRRVVESSCSDPSFNSNTAIWVLWSILDLFPFVSSPEWQSSLLEIMSKIIFNHFDQILAYITAQPTLRRWLIDEMLNPTCLRLWAIGSLDDALTMSDTAIKYLCSCSDSDNLDAETKLRGFQGIRSFVLGDMGRIPEAVDMIQQTEKLPVYGEALYYTVQIRILRHTGRNREAVQTLRRLVSETSQTSWIDEGQAFLHFRILLAELAAVQLHIGQIGKALEDAERAVTGCRPEVANYEDGQKCALVHSLITLSNCLAAAGRNNEALDAAKEAASIYTLNSTNIWGSFRYTIRR
ncbi:hypothetical protein B0H17DRAFT_103007 [Mycena rosella]|uniref:Fungal N-terminal domain-containing protein n=1 Tax=Mycena rosella TaxID=1033263 RepID=A0AAD7D4N2_MYCRO|nr:hypothetical protein B0H17DRAFT_103007 [Mycena rosella]